MSRQSKEIVPGPLASSAAVSLNVVEPVARFSLRARAGSLAALSRALGLELPVRVGARANAGRIEVLCFGPDEWQVLAPEDAPVVADCAAVYADAPHSLTEISDREVTVRLSGPKADELLTLGCPRDIDSIAVGAGRRTLFDGATVILWRDGAQEFRMDIWRSFAPHVLALLETGVVELAAE